MEVNNINVWPRNKILTTRQLFRATYVGTYSQEPSKENENGSLTGNYMFIKLLKKDTIKSVLNKALHT
jgi:hypothetical protein